jgi:primosomal protein N'
MAANTSVIIATSLITTAAPQQANKTNKKHIPGLTILLNADAPLALPDYEAAANCFHLIHDTITHSPFSNIIIQTQKPDHPTVRLACSGKVHEFEARNTERKKQHQYPPFGDVCVLMYKNEVEKNVFSTINKLYQELLYLKERQENNNQKKTAQTKDLGLTIYATPPLIYKAYNKYRYNIIIR